MPTHGSGRPGLRHHDVVVVTGGSRGIGAELARRFAAHGVRVGIIGRDADALTAVRATLPAESHVVVADVADGRALAAAIGAIEQALGPIAVLVNNAGHGAWDAVLDTDPAVYRETMEVNYLGTVRATQLVLPGMLRRRRGHIINISSIAGRIGAPFEAAYSASKFAVVGFSEALAVEVAGTGVDVSLIHPGPVATEFAAARRRAAPRGGPRPVPVSKVGDAVLATVHRPRRNRYVPAWLGLAVAAKTLVPPAHRWGTARMFAAERRDLRQRIETDLRLDNDR
jgi:short-subunit dehydrogenase